MFINQQAKSDCPWRHIQTHYGRWQSGPEDERAENFGFLRREAEELACQGVNPWDDDTGVSLIDFLSLMWLLICLVGCIGCHFEIISNILGALHVALTTERLYLYIIKNGDDPIVCFHSPNARDSNLSE